jgi:hypothetical protein
MILYSDAGGMTGAAVAALSVAVECMAECPANSASSQVCVLDADGGSPTACPEGTSCRNYLPAFLASSAVPNTLCLPPAPTYDGGYGYLYPGTGGGTETDGGNAASTTVADAASD